jgi:choline dehydrogenase
LYIVFKRKLAAAKGQTGEVTGGTDTEADYVIVGAGSAGCALAWALSANPAVQVLLVEAGGAASAWRYRMPAALAYALAGPEGLWTYVGDPEPGLGGRRVTHPRGRMLGGTSAINGMMFVRGHRRDFDGWAAAGAAGWDHAAVLPSFRAMERFANGGDAWRGDGGPLAVRRAAAKGVLDRAFLAAAAEAGHPASADFNGVEQAGAGRFDQTIRDGVRETAATAFLAAAAERANLTLRPGCRVTGLAVDRGRVIGVRLADAAILRAGREVILAAGAFGSPHLLLLSGIGPAADLRRLGIPVVADRPGVGANLQDHPDLVLRWRCRAPVSLHGLTRPPAKLLAGLRWFATHRGPAATNHFETGAFLPSGPEQPQPDLQLSFLPLALAPGAVQSDTSVGEHGFQVHVDLVKPRSRGRLTLAAADPGTPPRLLFNYLAEEADVRRLARAVGIVREIVRQPAFAGLAGAEIDPAPGNGPPSDDWIRARADTAYHPVGTCRMGRPDDPMAVTDPEGRVIGIAGLRVADASVMPDIVGGNTNAAAMMIGVQIARRILPPGPTPEMP